MAESVTFTAAVRQRMYETGTGVRALARVIHRNPGYVSKILSGQRPCGPALARSIDDALGAGGQIIASAAVPRPRPPSPKGHPLTDDARAAGTPRRDFVLLAASAAALLDVLRAAPAAPNRPGRVDAATVAGLESVMGGYRQVYQSAGAQSLLDPVCGALGLFAGVAPGAGRHRDQIVSLIGQAASLAAAMLLLDAGDAAAAARYAAIASRAAAQSGDRELAAITLAVRAFRAAYSGDAAAGVELACAATDAARGAHPRTRGWVAAVAAEMHASAGDEAASMRALDASAAALAEPEPAASWKGIGAFGPAKLTAYRGGALMRLRRYGPARDALRDALGRLDPEQAKHRCTAWLDLADACALDGLPEEACAHAGNALDIIDGTRHAESLRRAAAVYAAVRPSRVTAARELGSRIAEARAQMAAAL